LEKRAKNRVGEKLTKQGKTKIGPRLCHGGKMSVKKGGGGKCQKNMWGRKKGGLGCHPGKKNGPLWSQRGYRSAGRATGIERKKKKKKKQFKHIKDRCFGEKHKIA